MKSDSPQNQNASADRFHAVIDAKLNDPDWSKAVSGTVIERYAQRKASRRFIMAAAATILCAAGLYWGLFTGATGNSETIEQVEQQHYLEMPYSSSEFDEYAEDMLTVSIFSE